MRVLIDTNIILDVLCGRKEFLKASATVFKLCEIKKVEGYISALSVPNIIYIMRKELDEKKVRDILRKLTLIFKVVDLKSKDLLDAAYMDFKDYEDALQSCCAARIKAEYIIMRNTGDFATSKIPAIPPEELLHKL